MKIVVIGGTGLIGARLVKKLGEQGHEALAASPSRGIDAFTGKGLAEALKGAQVVVDTSNAPSWEATAVMQFFQTSTRNLLEAEVAACVRHHVALSVVGAERMPGNTYMPAKLAQESAIQSGPIPYTIVRATQFFEFVGAIADSGTVDGTVRLPPIQFQPIAADDIASILARIAVAAPLKTTIEIAGPERKPMEQFVRHLFAAKKDQRPIVTDPNALYFAAKVDDQSLVPINQPQLGKVRFEDWLALNIASPAYAVPN
ncbi:MAG TPA: SDR family oxidoreductase [Verrucomicrobiae bacterium]|nr:SDR family oxidoreductase [Verrucomicrobiae bacterium]